MCAKTRIRINTVVILLLIISLFREWIRNTGIVGYESPEMWVVIAVAALLFVDVLLLIANRDKLGAGLLPYAAGLAVVAYFYLQLAGKSWPDIGGGLRLILIAAGILLLAGLWYVSKHPRSLLLSLPALLLIAGGAWYGHKELSGNSEALPDEPVAYTLSATNLLEAFSANADSANAKFRDKLIGVTGKVTDVIANDSTFNLQFEDTTTGNILLIGMQPDAQKAAPSVKPGDSVLVKALLSGGSFSEILESTNVDLRQGKLETKF